MTQPASRWLDDDEQRTWRALAGMMMRLPGALDAQVRRDSGLNHFSYWVLAMLSEAEGRTLAMSDLARSSNSSQSRLSHAVSGLERAGLVTRSTHPDNGRVTLAHLSEQGMAVVVRTAPGHADEVVRLVMADLSAEQRDVVRQVCEQVLERMDGECRRTEATMAPCPPDSPPDSPPDRPAAGRTSSSSAGATTA